MVIWFLKATSVMSETERVLHCPECRDDLVEIDLYGERLDGCPRCNMWGAPGGRGSGHNYCRLGRAPLSNYTDEALN
jgi:hypothetical protein